VRVVLGREGSIRLTGPPIGIGDGIAGGPLEGVLRGGVVEADPEMAVGTSERPERAPHPVLLRSIVDRREVTPERDGVCLRTRPGGRVEQQIAVAVGRVHDRATDDGGRLEGIGGAGATWIRRKIHESVIVVVQAVVTGHQRGLLGAVSGVGATRVARVHQSIAIVVDGIAAEWNRGRARRAKSDVVDEGTPPTERVPTPELEACRRIDGGKGPTDGEPHRISLPSAWRRGIHEFGRRAWSRRGRVEDSNFHDCIGGVEF
jgi:hypothetical protein